MLWLLKWANERSSSVVHSLAEELGCRICRLLWEGTTVEPEEGEQGSLFSLEAGRPWRFHDLGDRHEEGLCAL